VFDWYGVGLQLEIKESELDVIRKSFSNVKEQKRENVQRMVTPDSTAILLAACQGFVRC